MINSLENISISHGTLTIEDLLSAFSRTLYSIDSENTYDALVSESGYMLDALKSTEEECGRINRAHLDLLHEADDLIDELTDALNELAPEGFYFGTHPGDGSDFGFWPIEYDDYI